MTNFTKWILARGTLVGVLCGLLALLLTSAETHTDALAAPVPQAAVTGELMRWHRITLDFTGPAASETDAAPNPFLDYRLQVTFTASSGKSYDVPGFFAGDGNGGGTGNVWRAHFSPSEVGEWSYTASFRSGDNVAVSLDANAGTATNFDGATGAFTIAESNKSGPDFRSAEKGWLRNTGNHYLTFAGSGTPWIKGGPDIPENFLGYTGFDNTPNAGHTFAPHAGDWQAGDPDWNSGAGRNIIGALNFIAEAGGNVIYFLPMNIGGDAKDTFPTVAEQNKVHYDVSKLAQWEIVFSHANARGIFLHFQLAETESGNENYHDGGTLGVERKLFYRELIARFGHHPGLEWNIGEENDYGTTKRIQFAQYITQLDPYDHPVTTHTKSVANYYDPLVAELEAGNPIFMDMTSFQTSASNNDLANLIEKYRNESAAAGAPWVVSIDEPQKIENDKTDDANGYPHGRQRKLWPAYLSGAGGFEWYVQKDGGGHGFDQQINDYRQMDVALNWTGHARDFMAQLPVLEMAPQRQLASSTSGKPTYCLTKPGEIYALYNEDGGQFTLDLSGATGTFSVRWFDPRNGGDLQIGTVSQVTGGGSVNLGLPPNNTGLDWAALVERTGNAPTPAATATAAPTETPMPTNTPLPGATPTATPLPGSTPTQTPTPTAPAPSGLAVTSFTLVNADTNQDIAPLLDGDVIDLAALPTRKLNVRANTSPAQVGSVRFGYDNQSNYATENILPYALAGDTNGNYKAWTPTTGSHTLTAVAYEKANASGAASAVYAVSFTVIEGAQPTPTVEPTAEPTATNTPVPTATPVMEPTPQSGTITGQVFIDENGNGTYDPGEAALANIIAILIDTSTPDQTTTITAVTNDEGIYRFVNVPPADYIISFALPPGYAPVSAAEISMQTQGANVDAPAFGVAEQALDDSIFLPLITQ